MIIVLIFGWHFHLALCGQFGRNAIVRLLGSGAYSFVKLNIPFFERAI
jgi:hypothetical protein